jgi:hypothetical protein
MNRRSCSSLHPSLFRVCALLISCALVCVGAPALAAADVLMTSETRSGGEQERVSGRGRFWLGSDRMRMEFEDDGRAGQTATVIFRADLGLYWALDSANRRYVQIDRVAMQQLGERVRRARSEMAGRLEDLPPEQRSMVEKMMTGMAPPAASTLTEELRRTDRTKAIRGHTARRYDLLLGDEIVGAIWMTDWQGIGIAARDFAVFAKLAKFQQELLASLGQAAGAAFGGQPFELFDRLDGYPLEIQRLQDGASESVTYFGVPERVPTSALRFDLPPGYLRSAGPGDAPPSPQTGLPIPQ